jgi:hypothetical protein
MHISHQNSVCISGFSHTSHASARLILPNSITIMILGRKQNVPVTYAARMLLAEQNESNVVTQLKETLRLSPALSLKHSLPLSFPLSRSTSLSLHSKLLLALRYPAVVTPHTLLPAVQNLHSAECTHRKWKRFICTVVVAALRASTLCPLLPAPLAQDNQPKAHFTIKIRHVVINMVRVNVMSRGLERKYAAEGGSVIYGRRYGVSP